MRNEFVDGKYRFPCHFRASGFRTAAVVTNPWLAPRYGFARGFEVYDYLVSETAPQSLEELRSARLYVRSGEVNARAFELLREWRDERFFLYLHYMDVHSPYVPAEPYRSEFTAGERGSYVYRTGPMPDAAPEDVAYTRALYEAEIRGLDDALRSLLDELAALGLDGSTTVVLTSDHGEEFLERGGMGHGTTLYREQTRAPLIIRHPGSPKAGKRVRTHVSLVDLWATLAELTGTEAPATDGMSLGGAVTGESTATDLSRRVTFSEVGRKQSARRGPHKVIRWLDPPAELAFDLDVDPDERSPVEEETEWRRRLLLALDDFVAEEPGPDSTAEYEEMDPAIAERLRALGYSH
jgi:arylsulfatase A-like enzyme